MATTIDTRTIVNPTSLEMEVEYTVFFPAEAAITKVDLNGKTKIAPKNAEPNQPAPKRPQRTKCADGLGKFSLLLSMKPGEQMNLNFEYEELIHEREGCIIKLS